MKIFVSYARVDKPYCVRIIETLHAHEVWYDQRHYADQDRWKEILRRLDWCDVFLYLLSPEAVASLYCRRELEIALRLKRDVIPVLIDRETVLPDNMKGWQYIDLSDSLTADNVAQLLNAILLVERQRATPASSRNTGLAPAESNPADPANPVELISSAVRALEKGDFDNAILLLNQAKSSGYQSRFVSLDRLLRIAEGANADRSDKREVLREYQHIVALFKFNSTRGLACEALAEFRKEFGDYDPQGLHRLCENGAPEARAASQTPAQRRVKEPSQPASQPAVVQARSQSAPVARAGRAAAREAPASAAGPQLAAVSIPADAGDVVFSANDVLPMLQWRDIPHGTVTIASIVGSDEDFGEVTEHVDNFVMSAYPVTNAQFSIFAKAADGYRNPRWWSFSDHAERWFKLGKGVAEPGFTGDDLPRENVNWYEAMAFANWLGNLLQMQIALPTLAQWQRAAKGDDDRYFPWGDEYDEEHCNTLETGLKRTTPVDRYHRGVSAYGAYDMAGNVWEWTLNSAAATDEGRDFRRAVVGGSYVSPCDRAQTSFRYYLEPRVRYSSIGIRLVGLT